MIYLIYFLILFVGFAIGRVGHILGGQIKSPHHWIYGVILVFGGMIAYFFFLEFNFSMYVIVFGLGLTISDLKDMYELKFYGVDPPGKKRFWHID